MHSLGWKYWRHVSSLTLRVSGVTHRPAMWLFLTQYLGRQAGCAEAFGPLGCWLKIKFQICVWKGGGASVIGSPNTELMRSYRLLCEICRLTLALWRDEAPSIWASSWKCRHIRGTTYMGTETHFTIRNSFYNTKLITRWSLQETRYGYLNLSSAETGKPLP